MALTIAGSDSGGGAGIQADLPSFAANGAFGTSAITCLTAQNPDGVSAIEAMPAAFVVAQLEQVCSYFAVRAIKTGMLLNEPIIAATGEFLRRHTGIPLVVDPVMVATSGAVLLEPEAVAAMKEWILPLASLITPNLDEAAVLLGWRPDSHAAMVKAATELAQQFRCHVLLKGGHLDDQLPLQDVLVDPDGRDTVFTNERIMAVNTHGSGCTLASAITARIACGDDIEAAVATALEYLQRGMRQPVRLNGIPFIRH